MSIDLIDPQEGDEEEITDLFGDQIERVVKKIKVGEALKFEQASLQITKVDKRRNRVWAKHVRLMSLDEAQKILQERNK